MPSNLNTCHEDLVHNFCSPASVLLTCASCGADNRQSCLLGTQTSTHGHYADPATVVIVLLCLAEYRRQRLERNRNRRLSSSGNVPRFTECAKSVFSEHQAGSRGCCVGCTTQYVLVYRTCQHVWQLSASGGERVLRSSRQRPVRRTPVPRFCRRLLFVSCTHLQSASPDKAFLHCPPQSLAYDLQIPIHRH